MEKEVIEECELQKSENWRNEMYSRYVAGLPKRYANAKMADLNQNLAHSLKSAIYDHSKKNGLLIIGSYGVGKTYACYALAKTFVWNNPHKRPLIKFVPDLIREIQSEYGMHISDDRHVMTERQCQTTPILILDDLGNTNGFTNDGIRILEAILDYRNRNNMPTIITTNLAEDALEKAIGTRAFERIFELCEFVKIKGENKRQ